MTLKPVTSDVHNEWELYVDTGNGLNLIPNVQRISLDNNERDVYILFGESPNSTDTFRYAQPWRLHGGGAATILWTRDPHGRLYVGGLMQMRKFIDRNNKIFNILRGMQEPKESTRKTALRETREETGRSDLLQVVHLPGESVNMDSAFFEGHDGGSVDFFAVEVPWSLLKRSPDGQSLVFKKDEIGLTDEQKKEGIFGAIFVEGLPERIYTLADAFTIISFARLTVYLNQR